MQNPITYYAQTPAIDSLCQLYGFMFNNHTPVIELLEQLDHELDARKATGLVIGIYSNLDFTQSK